LNACNRFLAPTQVKLKDELVRYINTKNSSWDLKIAAFFECQLFNCWSSMILMVSMKSVVNRDFCGQRMRMSGQNH
jgi:hypothetical protein